MMFSTPSIPLFSLVLLLHCLHVTCQSPPPCTEVLSTSCKIVGCDIDFATDFPDVSFFTDVSFVSVRDAQCESLVVKNGSDIVFTRVLFTATNEIVFEGSFSAARFEDVDISTTFLPSSVRFASNEIEADFQSTQLTNVGIVTDNLFVNSGSNFSSTVWTNVSTSASTSIVLSATFSDSLFTNVTFLADMEALGAPRIQILVSDFSDSIWTNVAWLTRSEESYILNSFASSQIEIDSVSFEGAQWANVQFDVECTLGKSRTMFVPDSAVTISSIYLHDCVMESMDVDGLSMDVNYTSTELEPGSLFHYRGIRWTNQRYGRTIILG